MADMTTTIRFSGKERRHLHAAAEWIGSLLGRMSRDQILSLLGTVSSSDWRRVHGVIHQLMAGPASIDLTAGQVILLQDLVSLIRIRHGLGPHHPLVKHAAPINRSIAVRRQLGAEQQHCSEGGR